MNKNKINRICRSCKQLLSYKYYRFYTETDVFNVCYECINSNSILEYQTIISALNCCKCNKTQYSGMPNFSFSEYIMTTSSGEDACINTHIICKDCYENFVGIEDEDTIIDLREPEFEQLSMGFMNYVSGSRSLSNSRSATAKSGPKKVCLACKGSGYILDKPVTGLSSECSTCSGNGRL